MAGYLDWMFNPQSMGILGQAQFPGGQPPPVPPPIPVVPPQPAQGPGMGGFGGFRNNFQNWLQTNPQTVTALAAGLLSGQGTRGALANVGQLLPQGMAADKSSADKIKYQRGATALIRAQLAGQPITAEMIEAAGPDFSAKYAGEAIMPKPLEATDDIKEYERSLKDPAFGQYQIDMRQAGAPRTVGTPPPGYSVEYDESGNPLRMVPIPGGPAAQEQAAADEAGDVATATAAGRAGTMLDTVKGIRSEFEGANTPVTGTLSRPFAIYSGSPAGRVRSYVSALQSGVALQSLLKLKEASSTGATGFGALSQRELQILIDNIGALDPDNTEPDIFMQTVDRIEQQWSRVVEDIRRNVSPERFQELGLDSVVGGVDADGGGWSEIDGVKIRRKP